MYATKEAAHQMRKNPLSKYGVHTFGSVAMAQKVEVAILDGDDHGVRVGVIV